MSPVVSKRQLRFMGAVASGKAKSRGLTAAKALEFIHATHNAKKLPEKVKKKKRG